MSAEDRVARATALYSECRSNVSDFREEARKCRAYVAGHQWDDADITKLKEEKRPVITFNLIGPYIEAICGAEVQNREEIRFVPR